MVERFRDRQYEEGWIQNAVERFKNVSQSECLNKRRMIQIMEVIFAFYTIPPFGKGISKDCPATLSYLEI